MSELLDFTGKKDFEDLKFGKGYHLTQDDISVFKEDCRRINTIHNQMALEQCKIGLLLSELKAGKGWKVYILFESGMRFPSSRIFKTEAEAKEVQKAVEGAIEGNTETVKIEYGEWVNTSKVGT